MIRGAAAVLAIVFGLATIFASLIGSGFGVATFATLFAATILVGRRHTKGQRS